jgi:hypothetical protein
VGHLQQCGASHHMHCCQRAQREPASKLGVGVLDAGCRVQGLGCGVKSSGFRVQGSGFRV